MKKTIAIMLFTVLMLSLTACATTGAGKEQSSAEEQSVSSTPDADWNLPETTEMTEEITDIFEKAMSGITGVNYEAVGYLGEKDGLYCILCRATVVSPDAKPYYTLVYVNDEGLQNTWDIWMDAHSTHN